MPVRSAEAQWSGDLRSGKGKLESESGAIDGQYSFGSRFEEGTGTNPEELIGAAHAACFSMALSGRLSKAGHTPEWIRTQARVKLENVDGGPAITGIDLVTRASVPGIDDETFVGHARAAKEGCPVSKALAAVPVTLDATLER